MYSFLLLQTVQGWLRRMTAFLRYLISTSVVGAIALAAIDGKAVLAAPSPKATAASAARAAGSAARAIEEWKSFPR